MTESDNSADTPPASEDSNLVEDEVSREVTEGDGGGSNDGINDKGEVPPGGGGAGDFDHVTIEDEMHTSFLGYAMSVIVGRALPDVRDGLKPVHRRCLFAMEQMNNRFDRPTVKCARVAGEVVGKYHPHGDDAVYETIVRMAQEFNMRYPLVQGQGNFGSMDGDQPAASRYTESRMTRIASMMMADLHMETVDFGPNYDETLTMPLVLPTRIPNLLVNGAYGIAVAMATNIPPHNLTEVINGCLALVEDPNLSVDDLMTHIQGPDLPTGGIIHGRAGIVQAYRTGNGRVVVRARAEILEDRSGKETIVVHEIPFQVNKAHLVARIAELVREKRVAGITELRDESDKDGLRIVMEIRRGELAQVILNQLYTYTKLEAAIPVNCVALVHGQPKRLNLKEMLAAFIEHRREVVLRRTNYSLRQDRRRGHTVEGYIIALSNVDEVVALIRAARTRADAFQALIAKAWPASRVAELLEASERDLVRPEGLDRNCGFRDDESSATGTEQEYFFSETQVNSILELQLHRLVSLEQDKLVDEFKTLIERIRDYLEILDSAERVDQIVTSEFIEVRETFGDARKTEIVESAHDLTAKELVKPKDVVVSVSHMGYVKVQPISEYRIQRRGGTGSGRSATREDDFVEHVLVTHNHDVLLCFTDHGRVFWLNCYEIPEMGRNARGKALVNLLQLNADERVTVILPIKDDTEHDILFFATERGFIKRTRFDAFRRPIKVGLRAIVLEEGDKLIGVAVTDGTRDIMLTKSDGKAVRFKESDVRTTGRVSKGVRGVRLQKDHVVISLIVPVTDNFLLTVCANGIGKRTPLAAFNVQMRGGVGKFATALSDRTGALVSALSVSETDQVMLTNEDGRLIRISAAEVSVNRRYAQGVRLMRLVDDKKVIGAVRIDESQIPDDNVDEDELD